MAYLETLIAAIRTRIAVVDTTSNIAMYEAEHVDMIPWATLSPPYWVIAYGRMEEGDWGGGNLAYEYPIDLYYVKETAGPQSGIRAMLESLRDDLRANELTTGQVIGVPEIVWDQSLEANQIFASKNYPQRCGRLTAQTVIGSIG